MEKREDIMAIARAFMRSRIILTAAELDLFTHIQQGVASAGALSERLNLDRRALTRVLDCLVNFDLLEKKDGTYSLSAEGAFFSSMHPASSLPMLLHMNALWDGWSGLSGIVRMGAESKQKTPVAMAPEARKAFIGAMHVVGRSLSEDVAASLDLGGFRKLMDIGGGSGTYTIAFLKRNPKMGAVLFDLPEVVLMARERFESEGVLGRAATVAGDFYKDELPQGCDVALLSAIIHQNSRAQNVDLYRKIFRAIDTGGMIVIRDHVMDERRVWPPEGALFAINMLVNTRGGDTYTFAEIEEDLKDAGFQEIRMVRTGERMDSLVTAVKPK